MQGVKLIPDSPAEQALVYQRMMEGLTLTKNLMKKNREALTTELRLWEGYLQKHELTRKSTKSKMSFLSAQDITLLWGGGSRCWRIMIALEEKGLAGYNQKLLSFDKMEHKSEEVLSLNPRGQLPAFKHGEIIVNESYAACFYLESQFKSAGNKLVPDGAAEQALMYQRMFEGLTFHDKITAVVFYDWDVLEEERHDSALKRNKEALVTELKLWEGYLGKLGPKAHLAGQSFTLADVTVFPTIATLFRFGLSADRYPNLGEYYARLKDRPSIRASWPPHWLENLEGTIDLKDT